MSVKPYNSYKFNKPLFKSEYSNITKSISFVQTDVPLIKNEEIVIPICEPTDIQGVRKFKNATLQLYAQFAVSDDGEEYSDCIFPIPYFLIATEYQNKNPQSPTKYKEIYTNTRTDEYFISTDYTNVNSAPTEILNKGTLLFQGQLSSKQALIQSTRLSKNLGASECIYLILKIPNDPSLAFYVFYGLFGTINYSVKFS